MRRSIDQSIQYNTLKIRSSTLLARTSFEHRHQSLTARISMARLLFSLHASDIILQYIQLQMQMHATKENNIDKAQIIQLA